MEVIINMKDNNDYDKGIANRTNYINDKFIESLKREEKMIKKFKILYYKK